MSDVLQTVEGVAGKTGNRFGDDHVDVLSHALVDHAVEFVSLFGVGAGDAVIRENVRQLPLWILLNVFCVVTDLHIVAGFLLIGIGTDSAVGSNTEFRRIVLADAVSDLRSSRDKGYVCHLISPTFQSGCKGTRPEVRDRHSSFQAFQNGNVQVLSEQVYLSFC